MSAFDLPRVPPPPPPPEPKRCVACKDFRAECVAPVGEGSAALCWLCAHHVVDHECKLEDAATHECECTPDKIYPGRAALKEWEDGMDDLRKSLGVVRVVHGDVTREMIEKATPEELLRGSSFSDACRERMREAVESMTPAQRKLLLNGSQTSQVSYQRAGASFTATIENVKGVPPVKIWVDVPNLKKP